MANRPTAQFGKGGSDGATHLPAASIVPARRARLRPSAANDNKPPLKRRLLRVAVYLAIAGAVAFLALG
ncbi:MAG TPA: hypothetical protein VGE72_18180 [Azospirillum sp.]